MDPLVELDAIEAYIRPVIPTATIRLLNLPETPVSNMLVIRYQDEEDELSGPGYSYIARRWQVMYYHEKLSQAIRTTNAIKAKLNRAFKIPFTTGGVTRYVTIRAFSPGQPNETDSDLHYTFSILETAVHGDIEKEVYEKMRVIHTEFTD